MAFTLSAFLQTTMQFPYVRKQIPAVFVPLLPCFVLGMFLSDVTAFILLYVALVALDLRPEFYAGREPVIVPYPYTSGKGNFIPGYIILAGITVIGYPWLMAVWRSIYKRLFQRKLVDRYSL
jgi:hypothetical protein